MEGKKKYLLLGSGGHARVLADLAGKLNATIEHVFADDRAYEVAFEPDLPLIIAIGNNIIRKRIVESIKHEMPVLIHPSAQIAADVELGEGTVILANAVIQAGARIGKHCLINANVVIDHGGQVGDFVNIYPNVYIGGAASISNETTIEPGTIIPRMTTI